MSVEQNKAIVSRFLNEVVSKGDQVAADELLAPNFLAYTPGKSEPINRQGFEQLLSMFRSAFPDMYDSIKDLIAEGDKVAVRVTIHGTHQGEFQGIAPTGRQIQVAGFAIFHIVNNKIVENRALNDRLGLSEQLGERG